MTEPAGRLERILRAGHFCVTAEVVPPRSTSAAAVTHQAVSLVGYADAVNVTDNPTAYAHMSPEAGAALVAQAGLEPTVQLTCRDRNRLGLTSALLGAWTLGARNLLCLTGDPAHVGDHPEAEAVFDLSVTDLVGLAVGLRERGELLTGSVIDEPPRYFVGVADSPLVENYDPTRLEVKLDAGAGFVMTQIVYDVEALEAWADQLRSRGVFERARVIAGIAPLRSAKAARHMNEYLPGVSVPEAIIHALDSADDAEAEGIRITAEIVGRLREIDGIAGVHVMGLGREGAVERVIETAGLLPRPGATSA